MTGFDWDVLRSQPRLPLDDQAVEHLFWSFHPRFRFFKTLPADARLLDIGAGSGGLHFWRDWGAPSRPDIVLFGADFQRGAHAAQYTDWCELDLDTAVPSFPGERFDGFLASHVLEHLADPTSLLKWMASVAAPGARVYLEWPHPDTLSLPTAGALEAHGFNIQILNFRDDATHRSAPTQAAIGSTLSAVGFDVVEAGRIDLGHVGRELLARGVLRDVLAWRQSGLWSATGWAAYAVGVLAGH